MLWLAGLLGIVGAGAASLIVAPFENSTENEDGELEPDASEEGIGNLLDHIRGASATDSFASETLLHRIALDPGGAGMIDQDDPDDLNDSIEDDWAITEHVDPDARANGDRPIMLGDWIAEGHTAEVLDYEPAKDSLMLVWDDLATEGKEPLVTVESDPFDTEVMHILLNGKSVAEIYGDPALSVADITTIPLSSALIVGLEPA